MQLEIEVWLRGHDYATTDVVELAVPEPVEWTHAHVGSVLRELLRAIERAKTPEADRNRPVVLRGFSWIVSPFEQGGFTVAVEIQLGAAAAGPFQLEQAALEALIAQAIADDRLQPLARSTRVH